MKLYYPTLWRVAILYVRTLKRTRSDGVKLIETLFKHLVFEMPYTPLSYFGFTIILRQLVGNVKSLQRQVAYSQCQIIYDATVPDIAYFYVRNIEIVFIRSSQ